MVAGVCQWVPNPIFVAGYFGTMVVWRGRMVLLMKNSRYEGLWRESIFEWRYLVGVPSMCYMGSSDMEKIVTLVIIYGTRVLFESILFTACQTWIVGMAEIEFLKICFNVLVEKYTSVGGNIVGCMFILSVICSSYEDIVVREPPGFGGGTASAILFPAFWKQWIIMVASALRYGLRFRAMDEWV